MNIEITENHNNIITLLEGIKTEAGLLSDFELVTALHAETGRIITAWKADNEYGTSTSPLNVLLDFANGMISQGKTLAFLVY